MSATRASLRATAFPAAVVLVLCSPGSVARAGDAPRAVAAIENDLVAGDPAVRAKAAAELADRFPDGAVAVPMLVDLLDDESPDVAAAAAKSIDSMALASVAPLAKFFADETNWKAGAPLAESLPVVMTLKGPRAADAFDYDRERKKAPIRHDELAKAALLSDDGRYGSPATPKILAAMRQADVRTLAAAALAMHGADAMCERGLAPPQHPGRSSAAASALPLAKSDLDTRAWVACRLLARARAGDPAVVAVLTQTLTAKKTPAKPGSDEDRTYSPQQACIALGAIGPAAASAAPVLLDLVAKKETSVGVVYRSADALFRMGKESDVVALLERKPPTAELLAGALASEGRAAATVVPVLIARMKASDDGEGMDDLAPYGAAAAAALPVLKARNVADLREALRVADVVLAIAPADPDGLKIVDAGLADRDPDTFDSALKVLVGRTPAGPALVSRLQAICAGKSENTPTLARFSEALGRCGPAAKPAVPVLSTALADAEKAYANPDLVTRACESRRRLVTSLGRIGPDAAAAVPALTALRDKGDETIRVPAAQALRRIQAKK